MDLSRLTAELLWPAALGAIPVAMVAAVICRLGWCRGATRHALWVSVLACFLAPMAVVLVRPMVASALPELPRVARREAARGVAPAVEAAAPAREPEVSTSETLAVP